jgi:regulator of replication initiation timing
MMPDSKSIVDRLSAVENQISKLNEDVKELKAVFHLVKKKNTETNN